MSEQFMYFGFYSGTHDLPLIGFSFCFGPLKQMRILKKVVNYYDKKEITQATTIIDSTKTDPEMEKKAFVQANDACFELDGTLKKFKKIV